MASVNQATVIGFVGDEPRVTPTQTGGLIASFSIATTERGYTKQDGTKIEDRTEWHSIVVFGRLAEVVKNYIHKGSSLYIQGKMRTRSYDDKNGVKRYITEIVADTLQMLDRKPDSTSQPSFNNAQQAPGNYPPPPTQQDEDLPF